MRLCPLGHGSLHDSGMGDGMVQIDLYARLLGLGDSGPCLSHHTARPSHKEREGWVSIGNMPFLLSYLNEGAINQKPKKISIR